MSRFMQLSTAGERQNLTRTVHPSRKALCAASAIELHYICGLSSSRRLPARQPDRQPYGSHPITSSTHRSLPS